MPNSLHDQAQSAPEATPLAASRRAVLGGVAGLGAVAAVTAIGSGTRLPSLGAEPAASGPVTAAGHTIIAHVRPGSRDEVTLYSGDVEVTVHDRDLVQALQTALGTR